MPNPTPWLVVTDVDSSALVDADGATVQESDPSQKAAYEALAEANSQTTVPETIPPIGSILLFGGSTAPTGYLLADGSAVSRTTYANLFVVFGTTYGAGDGLSTFNLPDLRIRYPRGKDAGSSLGATGGATSYAHSGAAVSAHSGTAVSAHSGTAVSAHSGTAVAAHSNHATTTVDNNLDSSIVSVVSSGTHSAHSVTQPAAHTVTQPADHMVTQPVDHTLTQPNTHTGVEPPFLVLHYIVKT